MKAEIASHQARYTLERLHAEYGGKIVANREEHARLSESMKHIEAVLKLLDPTYSARSISVRRRKPNAYFKRGTLFRHAIDVLRTAEKPLTASEITERMIEAKGGPKPSKDDFRTVFGGVQASLRNNDGKAVERDDDRSPARWLLKRA